MGSSAAVPPLPHGRLYIVLAAVFWSLSGACTRLLTHDAGLTLGPEPVSGLSIAFFRAFFGGLVLLGTVRRADVSFRRLMLLAMVFFAVMNATFVLAMAWGKSSNAILLQYTAPMWMYLASVWWLGEQRDRRSSWSLLIGLLGIAVILVGGWTDAQLGVILIALVSGFTYAGVLVCLRALRDVSPRWLTAVNHLSAALILVPVMCWLGWQTLTPAQLGVLLVFGTVQMALPYWLVARGLRVVSPQEAGTILLLEPLLNPLWAFLVAPARETPSPFTLLGGACIIGALAWRYWPRKGALPRPLESRI
jgi:drug/metabolite transporter (DMT)-like permease